MSTTETKAADTTTGSAVNPAAKPQLPKIKPETREQIDRLKADMAVDPATNVIAENTKGINAELENLGYTREGLTKMATDLHGITAAYAGATGEVAHAHWAGQKPDERGPVVGPMSLWDGQSTTFTHTPVSIERIPGTSETTTVHGQVNISNHTSIGRNTGQMTAVRSMLRHNAAEQFGKN